MNDEDDVAAHDATTTSAIISDEQLTAVQDDSSVQYNVPDSPAEPMNNPIPVIASPISATSPVTLRMPNIVTQKPSPIIQLARPNEHGAGARPYRVGRLPRMPPPVPVEVMPEPIITRENMVPVEERPPAPRDETPMIVNGIITEIVTDNNTSFTDRFDAPVVPDDQIIRPASPTVTLPVPPLEIQQPLAPVQNVAPDAPVIVIPTPRQNYGRDRVTIPSIPQPTPQPTIPQPIQQPTISQPTIAPQIPVGSVRSPLPKTSIGGIRQPIPKQPLPGLMPQPRPEPRDFPETPKEAAAIPTISAIPDPVVHNPLPTLPTPNLPDYNSMSSEVQAQHRANFRTRFGILRNAWPNYHIPDVSDTLPLEQIHAQYDIYVRHIHISQDVDQYKVYLVIMFLLIELFCIKIGLNIGGYTVSQMRSMNKYERLLIELGETNYRATSGTGAAESTWPVEIRIVFMALVNAVTFIIIKMLSGFIGDGVATTIVDALSSYLSGTPAQPGSVLFGGPNATQPGAPQGPGPMPTPGGAFGGIDIPSLIANFGSAFIRGQTPGAAPVQAAQVPAPATTPRFMPAYDE